MRSIIFALSACTAVVLCLFGLAFSERTSLGTLALDRPLESITTRAAAPQTGNSADRRGDDRRTLRQHAVRETATDLTVLGDGHRLVTDRLVALDRLHGRRRSLPPPSLRSLLGGIEDIVQTASEPALLRSRAACALGSLLVTMRGRGILAPQAVEHYHPVLLALAGDRTTEAIVRGGAIRSLGSLRVARARPALRGILADPRQLNQPHVGRNACLALARIAGPASVPTLGRVLHTTTDSSVFGSASFALGQIHTHEAVVCLVQNSARFPDDGSIDAVLVDMEDVVLGILRGDPAGQAVGEAIRATRHLWKEGQRERYTPLLLRLIPQVSIEVRNTAVQRLIEDSRGLPLASEKRALGILRRAIGDHPVAKQHLEEIAIRSAARLLRPTSGPIPVHESRRNN